MAIKITSGFKVSGKSPIDTRIVLTKAEMLSISDKLMPEKYFALCSDDDKIYVYNKSNEISPTTGKFRLDNQELIDDVVELKKDVNELDETTVKTENALTEEEIKDITK